MTRIAMLQPRCILHLDMDAFFASVEQLDDRRLVGLPLLVGHDGPRGVVAAASYEARRFGCRSAQPMAVAKRLCPHAVVVPVRHGRYREESQKVFAILEQYTPLIEPLSLDEAFLDVTASQRLFGDGQQIARRIKAEVRRQTGLTASVGIAPNKFLAKIASDLRKPDGLVLIRLEEVDALLATLPIGRLWGVGGKTEARLQAVGVKTIGDLRTLAAGVLELRVGKAEADHFLRLAHGIDDRPVVPDRQAKSIGQEQTFGVDLEDPQSVRDVILEQSEQVAGRLRRRQIMARCVTVKIRYGQFQTITRRCSFDEPTNATQAIWRQARALFDRWAQSHFQPVRLIGVTAGSLGPAPAQLELFANPQTQRQKKLDQAVDQIQSRFGPGAIRRSADPPAGERR